MDSLLLIESNWHLCVGPLVQEVHQVYNDWLSQVVRVYAEETSLMNIILLIDANWHKKYV